MNAVTDTITQMRRQEHSSDEGEDTGPESSNDETQIGSGSSDEEEEVAPPAPSSGRPLLSEKR